MRNLCRYYSCQPMTKSNFVQIKPVFCLRKQSSWTEQWNSSFKNRLLNICVFISSLGLLAQNKDFILYRCSNFTWKWHILTDRTWSRLLKFKKLDLFDETNFWCETSNVSFDLKEMVWCALRTWHGQSLNLRSSKRYLLVYFILVFGILRQGCIQ